MRRIVAFALIAAAATVPALAHDTWLLPRQWHPKPSERLVADLTSAMDFPKPETAVRADRLVAGSMRLNGTITPLEPLSSAGKTLRLATTVSRPGVAALWIVTLPRTLDLKPDEVEHYLEEVGAWDTVGEQWRRSGGKTWRETYTKVAKTLVSVGESRDGTSWSEPVGAPLELVPASDPAGLVDGSELSLRLLCNGKPVADLAVGAVSGSGAAPVLRRTDGEGQVSFRLDRPGPWLFRATLLRPAKSRSGEWESTFTTLTLDVRPR